MSLTLNFFFETIKKFLCFTDHHIEKIVNFTSKHSKAQFFNVHGCTSWDLGLKGCYVILGTMLRGGNEKPKRNRKKGRRIKDWVMQAAYLEPIKWTNDRWTNLWLINLPQKIHSQTLKCVKAIDQKGINPWLTNALQTDGDLPIHKFLFAFSP